MTQTPVVLIAQREVRQRLRSRAFLVFTVLIAVIIVGIGVLARVLSDSGSDRATVAVVGDAPSGLPEILREIGKQTQLDLEVTTEPSRQAAVTAVESGASRSSALRL